MGALFPDSLGMVTALYELAFSASLSLGPLMGGFLYDSGGFSLPFIVTGMSSSNILHKLNFSYFFPSNSFFGIFFFWNFFYFLEFFLFSYLRRRRKKALLKVNDRGSGWKMCTLGL